MCEFRGREENSGKATESLILDNYKCRVIMTNERCPVMLGGGPPPSGPPGGGGPSNTFESFYHGVCSELQSKGEVHSVSKIFSHFETDQV